MRLLTGAPVWFKFVQICEITDQSTQGLVQMRLSLEMGSFEDSFPIFYLLIQLKHNKMAANIRSDKNMFLMVNINFSFNLS